ncbi:MAG TPA: hypothetical protein VM433_05570 [Mycobacteriales bacterium]|nr:hypothetical protein [Mycobacteriales bacterium]
MTTAPFALRLDPAGLERGARTLQRLAAAVSGSGAAVAGVGHGMPPVWTGPAASAAGGELDGLSRVLHRCGPPLADAAAALSSLAAEHRHAVEAAVPALCRRWELAEQQHRAALARAAATATAAFAGLPPALDPSDRALVRAEAEARAARSRDAAGADLRAEQARLRREFDLLRSDLAAATRAAGSRLAAAVIVPVDPRAAALASWGGLGGLLAAALLSGDVTRALGADLPLSALAAAARRPPDDLAACAALLDAARAAGLPPTAYAATLERYWLLRAFASAGIDPAAWDPARGAAALEGVVAQVYRYYGDLFLADRDLHWAGMANAIGPSFAAGFADLAMFRQWARAVQRFPLPTGVDGAMVDAAAALTDADLRAYEQRFLLMQRRIFEDQAPGHEAYRTGGLPAVQEMVAAGLMNPRRGDAWAAIASGDPGRVASGNREHLWQEQHDVIAGDYDWMRQRATGPVVTWGATLAGAPSIPGARSYPEVFPLVSRTETPGPSSLFGRDNPAQGTVVVTTPLPAGNISVFADRWSLIEEDTLPAYQRLLADGDAAERLARQPVDERIAHHRLAQQWDDLAARMARGTRIEVEQ